MAKRLLWLVINGRAREDALPDHALVIDYLGDTVGLTETKQPCDNGEWCLHGARRRPSGAPRHSRTTRSSSRCWQLRKIEAMNDFADTSHRCQATGTGWDGLEAPETTPRDEVHYLVQPYHALKLALDTEQRAEALFARLVLVATSPSAAKAERALRDEEREHAALVRTWLKNMRTPGRDRAEDPNPAAHTG